MKLESEMRNHHLALRLSLFYLDLVPQTRAFLNQLH